MDRLARLYKARFSEEPSSVAPITGSASNRQYFRLSGSGTSCIGVIGTDAAENSSFLSLAAHFRSKGISVPEVLAVSDDGMTYLQEDLGGDVLFDLYKASESALSSVPHVEELLCRTMATLPKIQFEGADGFDFDKCFSVKRFDRRLVMFDLNYFKYCFLKPSGLEFNEVLLQDDFERLADDLLTEDSSSCRRLEIPSCGRPTKSPEENSPSCGRPTKSPERTFLYRDFNSRNVMVRDEKPYFIDFQGGMQGPIFYDVASFIWHARSGYPEPLKEKMLSSYLDALREYVDVDETAFRVHLSRFVLFRSLQVLGAYGFRGLVEQKAKFITGIPAAISALKDILKMPFEEYPYLMTVLGNMVALPKFAPTSARDGVLEVRVCSFSFHKGIPQDMSGNGGGYVFDCRSIHNPGRYASYKKLTGRDEPVIRFLEEDGEVFRFLEHVYGVVDPHVETFSERGFTSLMVSFGCTGGQHRSVYCAEHLAGHLSEKYPHVRVHLSHREQTSIPPVTI